MSKRIATVAAAALVIVAAQTAGAQKAEPAGVRSNPVGFFGGLYLNGSGIKESESDAEQDQGGGLSLQAGYAFKNKVALFVDFSGANVSAEGSDDSYALGHFDIGARYQFSAPARAWTPFVEAAVGGRAARFSDLEFADGSTADVELSGTSFSLGGGTHYFFNPAFGLSANLRWSTGTFDRAKIDGEEVEDAPEMDATTTRLNLGAVWYPRGR